MRERPTGLTTWQRSVMTRGAAAFSVLAIALTGAACASSIETAVPAEPSTTASTTAGNGTFVDPQGTYSLELGPAWQANHGTLAAEIEVWLVAPAEDGFAPNVNVLTQVAPGMTTESYLQLSIDNAPVFFDDFELIEQDIIAGEDGQPLAVMEYTGDGLQYLGVFAVGDDQAVVATLTAPPTRFAAIQDDVAPYLLTLQLAPN